jgi:hypothetical protein
VRNTPCRIESPPATGRGGIKISEVADLDIISDTLQMGYIQATTTRFCA